MGRSIYYVVVVAAMAMVCVNSLPFDSNGNLPTAEEVRHEELIEENPADLEQPSPLALATGMPPIPGSKGKVFFAQDDTNAKASQLLNNILATPFAEQDANAVVPEQMPPVNAPESSLASILHASTHTPSKPISEGIDYEGQPLGKMAAAARHTTEEVVQDEIVDSQTPAAEEKKDIEKKATKDAKTVVEHEDKLAADIAVKGKQELTSLHNKLAAEKAQEPHTATAAAVKPIHAKPVDPTSGKPTLGQPGTIATLPAKNDKSGRTPEIKVDCDSPAAKKCDTQCAICAEGCAQAINPAPKCAICKATVCTNCIPFLKCLPHSHLGKKHIKAEAALNVAQAIKAAEKPVSKKGRAGVLSNAARKASTMQSKPPHAHAGAPSMKIKASAAPLKAAPKPHSGASTSSSVTLITMGITALVTAALIQ